VKWFWLEFKWIDCWGLLLKSIYLVVLGVFLLDFSFIGSIGYFLWSTCDLNLLNFWFIYEDESYDIQNSKIIGMLIIVSVDDKKVMNVF